MVEHLTMEGEVRRSGSKVLVIPRKRWLRPDMTEKLLTGTLRSQHKQTNKKVTNCLKC